MSRRKITTLAFVIVVLSFVLSTVVSLVSLHRMAQQNLQELNKMLASRIYDSISSELSEPITVSRSMANDRMLVDALANESAVGTGETERVLAEYLTAQKDAFRFEAAFVVSDASLCYYSYGGINKRLDLAGSDRDQWYARFVDSRHEYELDVDRDEVSQDQWTVFVDARIEDASGRLLGVCGVGARMTGNQDLFVSLEQEYGVRINLIDAEGLIHADTDESRIEKEYLNGLQLSQGSEYVYQKLGAERFAVTKYVDKLGWYLVIQSDAAGERRQLLSALLLNIVLCGLVLVVMLVAVRVIASRTLALASASFVDQTTRLLNRRAFEERKAQLAQSPPKEDFVYLIADLNGLKRANDTLGHEAGDELIRGAADCLRACFGAYGKIYRIGGDEFAAMLNLSKEQLEDAMAALDAATAGWRGEQVKELSLSCGCASSREFPSENVSELGRISDERMYAAKEAYYKRTGYDRRR